MECFATENIMSGQHNLNFEKENYLKMKNNNFNGNFFFRNLNHVIHIYLKKTKLCFFFMFQIK